MIEIVVAVCLINEPSRCKDVTLNFEGQTVSSDQCMTNGQIEMANWIGEHPNWVIQGWHSGTAGRSADL